MAALVATVDSNFSTYFSVVTEIDSTTVATVRQMMTKAVAAFQVKNRLPPANIIAYREGLSLGQINAVVCLSCFV